MMLLVSKNEMSAKLAKSWAFLSGVDLTFTEREPHTIHLHQHDMAVVIPVTFLRKASSRAMAIGLIIDEYEANRVASFMFGISPEQLTEEDVRDACKESCNVLGSGLIFDEGNKLGVPLEISGDNFLSLQQSSSFNVTFSSNDPYDGRIVLTILDLKDDTIWSKI